LRILFLLNNVSKTRHFEGVIAGLVERGHAVVLAAARQRNRPLSLPKGLTVVNDRLIAQGSHGRIEVIPCPARRVDAWQTVAPALRQARDYLRFQDPRYAHADKLEQRSAAAAPTNWPHFVQRHAWVRRHWRHVSRTLAAAERLIPTDPIFDLFIKYEAPDVVLVTPLVDFGSYQTDYVKSAHRAGVPVAFLPFSWDNLTNRGLIRIEPDRILVWNDIQKREAVDLHGAAERRVVVTGAPRFDEFFSMRPSTERAEFCRERGLDPASPFLLYLCSSEFVAPREVEFVKEWIRAVRGSAQPNVRSCGVLVRPHPAHLKQWRHVDLRASPNVALWTEKETMNADQGLYDSLHHAAAVVGLNTSAMIEAGILGKPVHTIVTERFAGGQENTLHFEYLRAENGGLLLEARSLDEHVRRLDESLRAGAETRQRSLRFVERFVRPRGLAMPVAPMMVEEIERIARIAKRPARTGPWRYPLRWGLQAAMTGARHVRSATGRRVEFKSSKVDG
jgi:hypothetical protein